MRPHGYPGSAPKSLCQCQHAEGQHIVPVTSGGASFCLACRECKGFKPILPGEWREFHGPAKMTVTQDQWEGLQAELSMLKSQVAELKLEKFEPFPATADEPVPIDIPLPGEENLDRSEELEALLAITREENRDHAQIAEELEALLASTRAEVRQAQERGDRRLGWYKEKLQQAEVAMHDAQETGDFDKIENYWREQNAALMSIHPDDEVAAWTKDTVEAVGDWLPNDSLEEPDGGTASSDIAAGRTTYHATSEDFLASLEEEPHRRTDSGQDPERSWEDIVEEGP